MMSKERQAPVTMHFRINMKNIPATKRAIIRKMGEIAGEGFMTPRIDPKDPDILKIIPGKNTTDEDMGMFAYAVESLLHKTDLLTESYEE